VFVAGVVAAALAIAAGGLQGDYAALSVLVAFVVLAERISVPLYFDGRLSISFMGVAVAALLLGPAATVIASAAIALAGISASSSVKKFAFNLGQHLLAGLAAFAMVALIARVADGTTPVVMLLSGGVAGAILFAVNTYGVAAAMSLSSGRRIVDTHREAFAWMFPHFAALGTVAGGLSTVYRSTGFLGVVIMALPLIMSRYAMKQVIDKTRTSVLELERSHEALQAANAEMRGIVEAVPDVLFQLDSNGIFVSHRAGSGNTGALTGNFIGRHITDAFPADVALTLLEAVDEVRTHGEVRVFEYRVPAHGGQDDFEARIAPAGPSGMLLMVRDIGERKRAEEAQRQAEQLLRTVTSTAPILLFAADSEGNTTLVEGQGLSLLGLDPEANLGLPVWSVLGDEDEGRASFGRAVCGESFGSSQEIAGRIFEIHYAPKHDVSGEIEGIIGVALDVTEHRKVESAMFQAQKLESLGVLAGGVAHDFNNLLVGILANAGLALSDLDTESPVRETVQQIELAGHRAADLARQILAYSGKGRLLVQPLDLNTLVEETAGLLRVSIRKGARLSFSMAPGMPAIEADATQLRQVVMNLVVNASDAIGEADGEIKVRTDLVTLDSEVLRQKFPGATLNPGQYLSLTVADTGSGMDPATRERIFEPFFTTKFTGRGLGLAAVLGIVRGHHGALRVASEQGIGTTFEVIFPASEGAAAEQQARRKASPVAEWTGHGKILIVDDEDTVRSVTARALVKFGFEVLQAADGQAGVDMYRAHSSELACVLLDMTMPRLNGAEAFHQMRAIRPDARVILMTGYAEEEVSSRFAGQGLSGFVQKPYDLSVLRETIRNVVEPEIAA
jgi:PAS domain S-box-containing protein